MFTPGFRLFFGFSLVAFVSAVIYGFFSGSRDGSDAFGVIDRDVFNGIFTLGWNGSVGDHLGYIILISLAGVAAFIGITLNAFRDGDVESVAELGETGDIPPSQPPTQNNFWPAAAALGVGIFIVGLGTSKAIWIIGLAVVGVVAFEWMLSAWADRATGDAEVNTSLRRQLMGPIELPVISLAGVAIVALALSRVFLSVSKSGSVIVASVIALAILLLGWLFASKPQLGKPFMGTVVALAAVGIIAAGIVSAAVGQREFHHHGDDHHEETDGDHSEGEAMGLDE